MGGPKVIINDVVSESKENNYTHIHIHVHTLYSPVNRSQSVAHNGLRTLELRFTDDPIGLKVGYTETRASVVHKSG